MQIHCTVSSPSLTNAKVCRQTPSDSVTVINSLWSGSLYAKTRLSWPSCPKFYRESMNMMHCDPQDAAEQALCALVLEYKSII